MIARPGLLILGVVLGVTACASPPGPLAAGGEATSVGEANVRSTGQTSPLEIQQGPLREIPRGEVSRIRQVIERRRGRIFTRYPGRDATRLGARLYVTDTESEIRRLTDQARALSGNVSALQPNPSLRDLARTHSMAMAARGQLSTVSSEGKTAADWLSQAGLPYRSVGIRVHRAPAGNFAWSPADTDEIIRLRREDWLNRSLGDANPLDPSYYDTGVGAVRGGDGYVYITAIFRQSTF